MMSNHVLYGLLGQNCTICAPPEIDWGGFLTFSLLAPYPQLEQ